MSIMGPTLWLCLVSLVSGIMGVSHEITPEAISMEASLIKNGLNMLTEGAKFIADVEKFNTSDIEGVAICSSRLLDTISTLYRKFHLSYYEIFRRLTEQFINEFKASLDNLLGMNHPLITKHFGNPISTTEFSNEIPFSEEYNRNYEFVSEQSVKEPSDETIEHTSNPYEIHEVYKYVDESNEEVSVEQDWVSKDRSGMLSESYEDPETVSESEAAVEQGFPNYLEIPETSFTCNDKPYIPGFYADEETDCQVFHACWPNRKESFLCPEGTTFNQQTLSCEFWYNSKCSSSYEYYYKNFKLALLPEVQSAVLSAAVNAETTQELDNIYLTLSLMGPSLKFAPILHKTTKYADAVQQSESSRLDALFAKLDNDPEEMKLSKFERKVFGQKKYAELFAPSDMMTETSEPTKESLEVSTASLLEKMQLKKQILKTDRIGDSKEEINVKSNEETFSFEEPLTGSDYAGIKISKSETKPFEGKDEAEQILSKIKKTTGNIINNGILPFTKDILASSYIKVMKKKNLK